LSLSEPIFTIKFQQQVVCLFIHDIFRFSIHITKNCTTTKNENALQTAEKLYVDGNIFSPQNKAKLAHLKQLPLSCHESAEALERNREIFETGRIFPKGLIDNHIKKLKSFNDKGLSEKIFGKTDEIKTLVEKYIHVG